MQIWQLFRDRTKPLFFILLLVTLLVLSIVLPINLINAEGEDGVVDLSLYQRSAELTRVFGTALAPGSNVSNVHMLYDSNGDGGEEVGELLPAGNAGAMLGYPERARDDGGIKGWLSNPFAMAIDTYTYEQLDNMLSGVDWQDNPFFLYAGYGETLTNLGLVKPTGSAMSDAGRSIGSFVMMLVYLAANAAPLLMQLALTLLVVMNPFSWFSTAIDGLAGAGGGLLSGVADVVGDLYNLVVDFGASVLLPALLVITIVGMLVFHKTAPMKRLARYGLRVFMLFAGLPLIAATYTGLIEDLHEQANFGAEYADYLMLSSYVDFEGWVKTSRIAPPGGVQQLRHPYHDTDNSRQRTSREIVLNINGYRAGNEQAKNLLINHAGTANLSSVFNRTGLEATETSGTWTPTFASSLGLLQRHMNNSTYGSSDYNGDVVGRVQQIMNDHASGYDAVEEEVFKMFYLTSSTNRGFWRSLPSSWGQSGSANGDWKKAIDWNGTGENARGLFTLDDTPESIFNFPHFPYNIYNSGDLIYRNNAFMGSLDGSRDDFPSEGLEPVGDDQMEVVGGLSPISVYNFLNTEFKPNGLSVYSSELSTSEHTRASYFAVTFGGTGMPVFMRWLENVVVMVAMTALAVAYGLMLVSASVKSIPRILSGMFGTALGSMQYITKLLISTAVLIIQVIGIIFLYLLAETIMISVLMNFDSFLTTAGGISGIGAIADFAGSFLLILIVGFLSYQLIKNAKVFTQMMEEVVSGAINRIMGLFNSSVGGAEMDTSKTTGGRIGHDGKLTEGAEADDDKGIAGALSGLATGEPIRRGMSSLAEAHDHESKMEDVAKDKGQGERGIWGKAKARLGTASSIQAAKNKDALKSAVGVEGKSTERERSRMDRNLDAIARRDGTALAHAKQEKMNKTLKDNTPLNERGQRIDGDGNVIKDGDGNALDKKGRAISDEAALHTVGGKPQTGSDGALQNVEGHNYQDEAGATMYMDDDGYLVDADGNYQAIDEHGEMVDSDVPISAAKAANALEKDRMDAKGFARVSDGKDLTHEGIGASGEALGGDGKALTYRDEDGVKQNVSFDNDGYLVGSNGERLSADDVSGPIGAGFETVTDPATGKKHVQHMGGQAGKHGVTGTRGTTPAKATESLASMAQESAKAERTAIRAEKNVTRLKAAGASDYAVSQAESFAKKARQDATNLQNRLGQEQQRRINDPMRAKLDNLTTKEQLQASAKYANSTNAKLNSEKSRLSDLKASGAPAGTIRKQERRVQEAAQEVKRARESHTTTMVAHQTGRSLQEVSTARKDLDKAQTALAESSAVVEQARKEGRPKHEIADLEKKVVQATTDYSNAKSGWDNANRKPIGSRQERDQAKANLTRYESMKSKLDDELHDLKTRGAPASQIKKKQAEWDHVDKRYNQARRTVDRLNQPKDKDQTKIPERHETRKTTAAQSKVDLAKEGISSYDDYSKKVLSLDDKVKQSAHSVGMLRRRLGEAVQEGKPKHVRDKLNDALREAQTTERQSRSQLNALKKHVHLFSDSGRFQPTVVNRPIQGDPSKTANQLVDLSSARTMVNDLRQKRSNGGISKRESEWLRQQESRSNRLEKQLIAQGFDPGALGDENELIKITRAFDQDWREFQSGRG